MTKHNDQERALFEAWRLDKFCGGTERLKKCSNAPDVYYYTAEQEAWKVWEARAQLPTAGGAVSEGWKLVPINPTDEMVKAAIDTPCVDSGSDAHDEPQDYRNMYSAMLAAAPHPVSGEQKPVLWCDPEALDSDDRWVRASRRQSEVVSVPLYAAPRAAQDVSGLVEALEFYESTSKGKYGNVARTALATHRAQVQGGKK